VETTHRIETADAREMDLPEDSVDPLFTDGGFLGSRCSPAGPPVCKNVGKNGRDSLRSSRSGDGPAGGD
jgi:hypothetical protein